MIRLSHWYATQEICLTDWLTVCFSFYSISQMELVCLTHYELESERETERFRRPVSESLLWFNAIPWRFSSHTMVSLSSLICIILNWMTHTHTHTQPEWDRQSIVMKWINDWACNLCWLHWLKGFLIQKISLIWSTWICSLLEVSWTNECTENKSMDEVQMVSTETKASTSVFFPNLGCLSRFN